MVDLYIPFIIVTLIVIIVVQLVERFFYSSQMQQEQSKLIAAIMSKNMNEYTHAVRVEKEKAPPGFEEPKDTETTTATDDEFMRHIREMNKE